MPLNEYGQPVGEGLGGWRPPAPPAHVTLTGRSVVLEPLAPGRHTPALYKALSAAPGSLWTYMGFGPFDNEESLEATLQAMVDAPDWLPYTFVVDGDPTGFASYLRINTADGVIEVGSIVFSEHLQQTTAATEGLYLMIKHAFDCGFRRCEWKCDDLNQPSRRAAIRLGFSYEGTFVQATHYKSRNRDTAWYAIVDRDWQGLDRSFRSWLEPENFDDDGVQLTRLEEMR